MKKKTKNILYFHGGSANHGCEAIVRSTVEILGESDSILLSSRKEEDCRYGLDQIIPVIPENQKVSRWSVSHLSTALYRRITGDFSWDAKERLKEAIPFVDQESVAFSIGGDNYCYGTSYRWLAGYRKVLTQMGAKTVLWGCSIEPALLQEKKVVEDLKSYSLITARESITYRALLRSGISKNTKIYPDPAFSLSKVELPLPVGFLENNSVGINVSPLIVGCEKESGITMKNYTALLEYILTKTEMSVVLIPHVVWQDNDDRELLQRLYEQFYSSRRVVLLGDHNCMELKGFIARCRFFVGARTHATIAAYSSCVPTLSIGYSVKAKGIAEDIFGECDSYVVPVQTLSGQNELIRAFEWLCDQELEIRKRLQEKMPIYCQRAVDAGKEIENI